MRQRWRQFQLDWEEGLRRLPFFTQRAVVALLGVLVATLALLGGLAALVQAPPSPREVEGSPGPGQPGAGGTTLAPPPGAAQPGGAVAPGPGGGAAPVPGAPGATGAGGVPAAPGAAGATPGVPATTLAGAAVATTGTGGRAPGSTSTTSTTKPPDRTLLPPITVTLTLPL
jgi:hypothetical protein